MEESFEHTNSLEFLGIIGDLSAQTSVINFLGPQTPSEILQFLGPPVPSLIYNTAINKKGAQLIL